MANIDSPKLKIGIPKEVHAGERRVAAVPLSVTKLVKLSVTAFRCAPNPFNKKDMCGADAAAQF